MSTELPVEIVRIDAIEPHSNPEVERLEVARVGGWACITGKGQFVAGDLAVYVPIEAVLPPDLVERVFANSKIKPDRGRIRAVRIQKQISYGLLLKPGDLHELAGLKLKAGVDVGELLGITKYEPPQSRQPGAQLGKIKSRKTRENPNFKVYTKFKRVEWMPGLFAIGDPVIITEKIHGTNFRAGWVPRELRWYERLAKWIGFDVAPRFEFVVGTHYKQLEDGGEEYKGYYEGSAGNVYLEAVEKYNLKKKLERYAHAGYNGVVLYGEVYGSGVQPPNFTYGCSDGERRLVIFDIQVDGEYLDHDDVIRWGINLELDVVPTLYRGPFSPAILKEVVKGVSVLAPTEPVREGAVIRPMKEEQAPTGRKMQKAINPDYDLLKKRSDNH